MIKLDNIWFSYSKNKPILCGINLEINDPITIIMGPNGAGKTTLLKIIACLYKPDRGRVIINNVDFWSINSRHRLKVRRNIVYIHEKPIIFKGKVIDNIIYPLVIRGYSREKAKAKATKLLRELNIDHLANRRRRELSAGEAQLVAFTRAIISGAKILILDEPTSALDLEHRRYLEIKIKELVKEGKEVIIATHDRLFSIKLEAKIYEINNGNITRLVSSRELIKELNEFLAFSP